jgi:hypothetical protein
MVRPHASLIGLAKEVPINAVRAHSDDGTPEETGSAAAPEILEGRC